MPILFPLNRTTLGGKGSPPLERKLFAGPAASDPARQTDWPNPVLRPYAQVFTGFVAGTSVALIASLSAVVPRAPTQYQIPARAVQQPFLYGTPTNLTATPAVAKPANQYDWPNPQTRKPNSDLYNWNQSLLTVIVPFNQTDWPNPQVARRLPDYTWIQSPQPVATAAVPARQLDWPNPQQPRRIDYTWVQSGLPYSTVGAPFRQTDWPNPRGPSFPSDLRTWITPPIVAGVPTAQYDWPVPRGPSFSNELRTWLQFPILQVTSAPFNQFDWPVPRGPIPSQDLRTWLQFPILPAPVAVPANQYDWPNPRGPQRLTSLSWEQTPALSLSVGTPFSQTDWPNPLRGLYAVAYQGFVNQSPINLGIPPGPPPSPPPPVDVFGGGGRLWPPMAMERALRKEEKRVEKVKRTQINIAVEKALDELTVDKRRQVGPKSDDDDDEALLLLS